MNMNMNTNRRRKRDVAYQNSSIFSMLETSDELENLLENIDFENYCDNLVKSNLTTSKQICSEEIVERTILTSFSFMHNFMNNETLNCYPNDGDNFVENIIHLYLNDMNKSIL